MELLQRMRHSSASPSPSTGIPTPLVPRSQMIQSLSLLTSCLDWVSSEVVGLSKYYDRMCNIVKRILDRVLTPVVAGDTSSAPLSRQRVPPSPAEEQQDSGTGASQVSGMDSANTGTAIEGLTDILEWPDFSLDWNQESWMEVLEGSNFLSL
jgi:hypothetical protein